MSISDVEQEKVVDGVCHYERRNSLLLVSGSSLSYLGDLLYLMAINIWVARVTGRPDALGLTTAVGSFALFLGNPIGGLLADRMDKKKLLILTDVVSSVAVLIAFLSYAEDTIQWFPLLLSNILLSFSFAIYSPTARAIAPVVAKGEGLRRLNSYLSMTGEIIKILAPGLGGALLAASVLNERQLILANSLSFLISAIANAFLVAEGADKKPRRPSSRVSLVKDYAEAWTKLGRMRKTLIPIALINFFSGGLAVLLPFLGAEIGSVHYPNMLLAEAVGSVLGGVIISLVKRDFTWLQSFVFLLAASMTIVGLHPAVPVPAQYVLIFMYGCMLTLFNVNFFTIIQKFTPSEIVGRTFGLIFTAVAGLVPFGNIIFGWLGAVMPGVAIPLTGLGMVLSVSLMIIIELCTN